MADFQRLRAEIVMVTQEMARTLRASCHFERQRPINARNVERLATEMGRGWFIAGTPIFMCVLPDGSMRIVNGNHTLEAVAKSDVAIPLSFIYCKVSDIEAAARIYACLDLQKVRTWNNALQALGMADNVPMSQYVLPSIGVIMEGFRANPWNLEAHNSRHARFQQVEEYRAAAAILAETFAGAPMENQRLMRRAAIFAVALYTARYQPSAATEFWGGAVKDDGLKSNDPRKALLRYATNNKVGGNGDRATQCRAAALAWNAFFEGRTLEYCKPNQTPEIRILGTPWHRGEPAPAAAEKPMFVTGMQVGKSGAHPTVRFEG